MPLYRSSQPEPPSRSASRLNSTPFREEQSKKKTTPSVAQPRCFKGQPEPRRTNSRLLQTSVLFGKHREATSPLAAPFCSLTTRIPSLGARSLSLAWTALPGIWLGLALPGSPDQGSSIRTEAALCAFPCFPPRSRLHSILLSLLWPPPRTTARRCHPIPSLRLIAESRTRFYTMVATTTRRRKIIGQRRRIEDEAEDEGGPESLVDLDDDSVTDGSIASDEHDPTDDSDTSNIDDASPTLPSARKPLGNGNAKAGFRRRTGSEPLKSPAAKPVVPVIADAESMLSKLSLADKENRVDEMHFDDIKPAPHAKDTAPIVVSSSAAAQQQPRLPQQEIKRREHEEYRRKRDEDPTFVPNRGAFFLHDHRHAGPAANGFRPFPRGARGRGRGAFGNHFAPISQIHNVPDPVINGLWKHDMHEVVAAPQPPRQNRYLPSNEGLPNGNGIIPTAPTSKMSINRAMSTEKHIGNTTIRVSIPALGPPKLFPGVALKQYTKLPDHRPPLRRDKPVRISIPYHYPPVMPRYIFPAIDRSFIFIPRAMRPNQQRTRVPAMGMPPRPDVYQKVPEASINELPQPQTHPLPLKPTFQESQPNTLPMHQPRPQKAVSLENIESPAQQSTNAPGPYQQPFHQQMPPPPPNGYPQDSHARHPSYQSQFSSSTPLSQIPERAVHAAPFQPNTYAQPSFYNQPYAPMPPQQGFYYPQPFNANMGPNANAPTFVPATQQQGQPAPYTQSAQGEMPSTQPAAQGTSQQQQNIVDARESQGTVYYDYYSQPPQMPGYPPSFPTGPQPYATGPGMVGMAAAPMMTPSPDTFYYQQPMAYYPQ
ncbi:hypothetical protein CHGG_07071 [Chaetomium globosum CBS 148.51]|uniref:Btz domain-containing protein n=1 Tax=Chaetomium globosum (strain ATCC 6205 / CBS 148.51 / DSM 1962 / NBRC 6347 / NRRL 1970) TaxID=306901 RepID=Q2GY83_CHAGB|nr:uncharacterized protein CHGG_07071 [Chaetomium globosum CBS 148.51]EAQ85818.1 hypothetical protein CHGG_07071 [Chaetomium globosum CBS 148.51]